MVFLLRTTSSFLLRSTGPLSPKSINLTSSLSKATKYITNKNKHQRANVPSMLFSMFGGAKSEINYSVLSGAPKEMGEAALAGEIPSVSKDGHSIATFAGGCFWGIELAYQRVPGVIGTAVGYTQGDSEKPTYEEVCSGASSHTEGIQVYYDAQECKYESLLDCLFGRIDPTLLNRVGNDRGTQYRHGVYFHTEEQKDIAQKYFTKLQEKYKNPIVSELKAAKIFWPAEDYHQQYLEKGGRFNQPQSAAKGCTDNIRCYG